MPFDGVVMFRRSRNNRRLSQVFVVVRLRVDVVSGHYVRKKYLEGIIQIGDLMTVVGAAVVGVHREVDALAPHALVRVVNVEAFLADDLRVSASCAVPQTVGG